MLTVIICEKAVRSEIAHKHPKDGSDSTKLRHQLAFLWKERDGTGDAGLTKWY